METSIQTAQSPQILRLYSTSIMGKYALVYGYELIKKSGGSPVSFEYLYDQNIPAYDYIDRKSRKNIKVLSLSIGTHHVPFENQQLVIVVTSLNKSGIDKGVYITHDNDIAYRIELRIATCNDGQDANAEILVNFVNAGKKYVENIMNEHLKNNNGTIKKYMFETAEHGHWDLLNVCNMRPMDSVFLPKDVKQNLVDAVKTFVTEETKAEYAKFNVPYKMNVLLHGVPGTGKTSCIHALASEIQSDIGIIHFSRTLDDTMFTKAINTLSNLENCKIVILEDIDCLFSDERKAHDTTRNNVTMSGLLNCLDGLARNEGILLFMTTNDRQVLKDSAFIRSCRIDLEIEFKEATRDQILDMIKFYFPEQVADCDDESLLVPFENFEGCTMASMQTFFFLHRKCKNIRSLHKEFKKFIQSQQEDACDRDIKKMSLYM